MRKFDYVYGLLEQYHDEYGTIDIPTKCVYHGYQLGICVHNIRRRKLKVTLEEEQRLNELGFIWRKRARFCYNDIHRLCKMLDNFYKENGHYNVPYAYITKKGIHLGVILNNIECGKRLLSNEDKEQLEKYHFHVVKKQRKMNYDEFYQHVLQFVAKNHHCNIRQNDVTEEGIRIGNVAYAFRFGLRKITPEQKQQLEDIGFVFTVKVKHYKFEEIFELIQQFQKEHGHCHIFCTYCTREGIHLGRKVYDIKRGRRKISNEQRKMLDDIGFDWTIGTNNPKH